MHITFSTINSDEQIINIVLSLSKFILITIPDSPDQGTNYSLDCQSLSGKGFVRIDISIPFMLAPIKFMEFNLSMWHQRLQDTRDSSRIRPTYLSQLFLQLTPPCNCLYYSILRSFYICIRFRVVI
jgi:hypothetical protein